MMKKLWEKRLSVPYRQQIQGDKCAAACLEMVLEWAGLPPGKAFSGYQLALFGAINYWPAPANFGDYGSPHGVAFSMNRFAPATRPARRFRLETTETPYEACGAIVSALVEIESPSIVLVEGGTHWVVVTGVQAEGNPRKGEYALKALWMQNPGNTTGTAEHLTYAAWLYIYFNDAAVFMPRPFVCVVDSRARAHFPGLPPPERVSDAYDDQIADPIPFVRNGLAQYGLTKLVKGSPVKPWPVNTSTGNKEGEPAYYAVSFRESASKKTVDIVLVDAFTGTYLGTRFSVSVAVVERGYTVARSLIDLVSVEQAGTSWETPDFSATPLVWRQCRESTSPFDFFYRVMVQGSPKYVRLDGEVFDELTPR